MPVLDASTLILLAKSDLLLLLAENTQINIPEEVQQEALARRGSYDALMIEEMIRSGKILVSKSVGTDRRKRVQADFGLEAGEAAALVLAKESDQALGTDDGPAIKAAKIMRIPFFTAVHVLLELHEKGRINGKAALAKLDTLQKVGRYSAQILEDARKRIKP
jgi:predicted nucleic acid-binding protein